MRIAVVGAGWAASMHAAAYADMAGVEVAAVVARTEPRARELAAKVRARPTTDLRSVLADDSIDAVDVCVPSGLHRDIAVAALRAGKHVFMETPMALSLDDAEAMLGAGRASGRVVAVGQLMKFVSEWAHIRDAVLDGTVGRPLFIHGARLSPPYWSADRPREFAVYGEPMVELMIFEYEYLQWLLGSPLSVRAWGIRGHGGTVMHAQVSLEYEGCLGLVEGSAMMPRTWPFTTYLLVRGEAGAMEARTRFLGGDMPETLLFHYPETGERGHVDVKGQDPYHAECLHFVRSLEGKADPSMISGESARDALRIAIAARESVTRGETLRLG